MSNKAYAVGDEVSIRSDLEQGKWYSNEDGSEYNSISSGMVELLGKDATVTGVSGTGYTLSVHPLYTFTYDMLLPQEDRLATTPYTFNASVEAVLAKAKIDFYESEINKGLEDGMYIDNKSAFQKLVDAHKQVSLELSELRQKN